MSDQNNSTGNAGGRFFQLDQVPPRFYSPCQQLNQFAAPYFHADSEDRYFDWENFKRVIDRQPASDLALNLFDNTTFHLPITDASLVAQEITRYLSIVYFATIDQVPILRAIEKVIQSRKASNTKGIDAPHIGSPVQKPSSAFIFATILDPSASGSDFHAMLTSIHFSVRVATKSQWWGLQSMTSSTFAARITGMRLVVNLGFQAPPHYSDLPPAYTEIAPQKQKCRGCGKISLKLSALRPWWTWTSESLLPPPQAPQSELPDTTVKLSQGNPKAGPDESLEKAGDDYQLPWELGL
ncbi:unnamed protein product [Rhizoctonia solani]|uniref:Uncharacterized protein n=1 Tax=Rhizoctonia solani TaxID=456999 RepID=A0A8H3BD88_9AGAM|nr:unnamed protein product [Rhizoctonia solani]